MESRIMQVFYGNDCLPYKDSARSIHYPIVGNSFIGASGTTQIRFYVRDIGGVNNVSWVAISKLPNGQIGNQVLSTIALDSELNEYYVALDLGSYYTQLKGDVYISLNGYQGGIQVEQDAETGIYTINGTPIIEATGSIKLAINYAPQLPLGHHFQIDDLQQILGLMSEKANIVNTVQVVADISQEDLSGYDNDQLFYDIQTKRYYKKTTESPYYILVEDNAGILGSDRVLVRYESTQFTNLQDVYDIIGTKKAIIRINQPYNPFEFIICFSISSGSLVPTSVRAVFLNTLVTQYADLVNSDASNYASMETPIGSFATASKYNDRILHENNYKDYAVPYSGAKYNVDLNGHKISSRIATDGNERAGKFELKVDSSGSTVWEGYLHLERQPSLNNFKTAIYYKADRVNFIPNTNQGQYNYDIKFPHEEGTFATREWTNNVVATLKANAFILVDTTEYPTYEDFMASQGEEGYIYLYPVDQSIYDEGDPEKGYYQYIWENGAWFSIGTTQINLDDYYTKSEVDYDLSLKVDKVAGKQLSTNDFSNAYKSKVDLNTSTLENVVHDATTDTFYVQGNVNFWGDYPRTSVVIDGDNDGTYGQNCLTLQRDRLIVSDDGIETTLYLPKTSGNIDAELTLATEEYVDDFVYTNAVKQTTDIEIVYGTDDVGIQTTYNVDSDLVGDGHIVRRNSGTGTIITGNPTAVNHATTKSYVDNAISNAIASVYKIKGSASVSQLNALQDKSVGDVYNLTDSGTLTDGSLQVFTGDNVVWTGSAWDKLGTEIDWSAYDEKFIAAGFFEVAPYNESTGEISFTYSTTLYVMSYDSDTGIMTIQAD